MFPRNGFLQESRSCPRIGPPGGMGSQMGDRFGFQFKSESPDGLLKCELVFAVER